MTTRGVDDQGMRVCVFGLGLMGRPMARALIAAGHHVRGWNRSPLDGELVEGIPLCRDLEDAAQADIALLMLADSAAVDAVLARIEPHLSAGRLVLDMGSSEPWRSKEHVRRLAAKGIGWIDAPVSGGPESAAAGRLAIMAGGNEADFDRVKPLLDTLGGNVVRVGGPGAGHTAKVVNQIIVCLTVEAVAEALTLAEKSGLDLRLVQEALKGGSAHSRILEVQGTRMIDRAYVAGGKVTTMLKDLRMALELASSLGADLPHVASTAALYEELVAQGDGGLDCSALHKLRSPDA
jgi:2-hydroxy-3-oxopropionate reductase